MLNCKRNMVWISKYNVISWRSIDEVKEHPGFLVIVVLQARSGVKQWVRAYFQYSLTPTHMGESLVLHYALLTRAC